MVRQHLVVWQERYGSQVYDQIFDQDTMKGGGYDEDEVEPVVIDLGDFQFQVPWARTTYVLGTKVDDQGDAAVMVEEQLRKAMGSLYVDRDVFFC